MAQILAQVPDPDWLPDNRNTPPRNLRKISAAELVVKTKFGTFSPKLQTYRQVFATEEDREARRLTPITMFIYDDDSGVAYSTNYWAAWAEFKGEEPHERDRGLPAIQWWRFDGPCDHDYAYTKLGNCWHEYTCNLCGYSYQVDSSG